MRKIVEREPRGKFSSRAGLFLFKACVAQDRLDDAKRWGQWTIEHHPRSLEAHKCQYKLAMVTMMEGKPGAARERFEALGDNPSGTTGWRGQSHGAIFEVVSDRVGGGSG